MCNFQWGLIRISILLFVGTLLISSASWAQRGLSRETKSSISSSFNTPFSNGRFRAIIIGNNNYSDPEDVWKPLNTAVADAKSVARELKRNYGFQDINLLLNATRRAILVALTKLSNRVKKNDSVFFYYAGHGYRNENTQEAYWIPVDAVGWDDSFFLSNARIKEKLAVLSDRVKHTLLVSDSCFSGTLLRGGNRGPSRTGLNEPFFRKVAKRKSAQILAAGGMEFVDDNYRNSGHSPFTYFLLKELKHNNSRYLTATSLSSNLSRTVSNNVQQTPQSGVLHGAGDEGGEFIFKRLSAKPARIAKPTPGNKNQVSDDFAGSSKLDPMAVELSYWNSVKEIDKPKLYTAYLNKYPGGAFADIARHKLNNNTAPSREIDEISEIIGRYKLTLESRDSYKIKRLSSISKSREQFLNQLLGEYKSFKVKVSGFRHIKNKHKATASIQITNLINASGNYVRPGTWSRFDVIVRKNAYGQWKVYW